MLMSSFFLSVVDLEVCNFRHRCGDAGGIVGVQSVEVLEWEFDLFVLAGSWRLGAKADMEEPIKIMSYQIFR